MKRVRIVIVIVFVALVVAIGWQVMKPSDEPVYKGKTLTNWIIEYTRVFSSPDGSESFVILDGNCDDVVREIGPNAVPTLLRLLRRRDSALRVRAMALLARQHVVKVDYVPAQR